MNEKKILLVIAFFSLIILVGGTVLLAGSGKSAQVTLTQNAKAQVDQKNFDWGNISFNGDYATKTFIIRNTGTDNLKLTNIRTSCHCTKAQVVVEGNTSPYFGMNTISSWVGEISPNKEANLVVIFDQRYHGDAGVGPINRFVSIETNDASNPNLEFSLTGTVIK